jgi:hypothetical protein
VAVLDRQDELEEVAVAVGLARGMEGETAKIASKGIAQFYSGRMPRRLIVLLTAVALVALAPAAAHAAACQPVKNPYAGTRYEGVDLSRIRAEGVRCSTARRVARRGHRKALGAAPDANGIVRVTWRGWRVRGDIKPSSDRYVARKGDRRVRWRF